MDLLRCVYLRTEEESEGIRKWMNEPSKHVRKKSSKDSDSSS